jgi:hypothetical protein
MKFSPRGRRPVKDPSAGVKNASRSPQRRPRTRCTESMSLALSVPKRLLVGWPLSSAKMGDTLLPKRLALPVFCSDPLSSNTYATEEILLVLSVGSLSLLHLAPWVAVSRANLGQNAALIAAGALLIDYVLTVAVPVAAGVSNIISAFPALAPHAVALSAGLVAVLAIANLRGLRESGTVFAVPSYAFVAAIFTMIAIGVFRTATGSAPVAESAHISIAAATPVTGGLLLVAVELRSFASGCTALTGVAGRVRRGRTDRPPDGRPRRT